MLSYKIDNDLELVLPQEYHAEEIYELIIQNFMHLQKWMAWLQEDYSINDVNNFIQSNLQGFINRNSLALLIVYKKKIVGCISFIWFNWENKKTEIAGWIGQEYQGKGIATKTCKAMIDYAFCSLEINRIEIHCATDNKKSIAIPERLGFKNEGIIRQAEWLQNHFVDWLSYSLLAEEWQK